jgi:hypothetical protein
MVKPPFNPHQLVILETFYREKWGLNQQQRICWFQAEETCGFVFAMVK